MPAEYVQGFAVREKSWHGLETLILEDLILPRDREIAMQYAGHDFRVIERPLAILGKEITEDDSLLGRSFVRYGSGETFGAKTAEGWKALVSSKGGDILNVVRDSYTVIQNDTGWDVLEAIAGEGAMLETGMVLHGGAVCLVTFKLPEELKVPGDDSAIESYGVVRWTHDGSGSLSARATTVRVVCANTDGLSQAESKKTGREFTFRHTRNVHDRIEDAKMALRGVREGNAAYIEMAEELAAIPVTAEQREWFIEGFIPMPSVAVGVGISPRVEKNVLEARAKVRGLFNGPTIPEAHKLTGYGLRLAGVEYLDHLRGSRNSDTLVGRQLLRLEPAKAGLNKLIREVAEVA